MLKNNSIDSKLLTSSVMIENSQNNPTIQTRLAGYGYDSTKMAEGQALLDDAENKQANQKKEYGEQFAATDALANALAQANKSYMKDVKISRIAFKEDRGIHEELMLNGRRRQTYSGWVQQASIFYQNALSNDQVKTRLTDFGIDQTSLEATQAEVRDVEEKLAAQLKEKGEAQEATQARDLALEELLDWRADYMAIARIAMEDEPQLLEVLGIVEPS